MICPRVCVLLMVPVVTVHIITRVHMVRAILLPCPAFKAWHELFVQTFDCQRIPRPVEGFGESFTELLTYQAGAATGKVAVRVTGRHVGPRL